ncbi:MAG: phage tail tape measure protein [Clostridium sp.]|nr:phage tail tape measure protein [Clostridium sp.]MCM1460732.1 phage tail tape measure protein [Bacteroides sp.]
MNDDLSDALVKRFKKIQAEAIQTGKKMYDAVVKVDSAMAELNKVSNASASEIKKYFDEVTNSAKRYGSEVSDMINATADWSRLGYNLSDSKKLAEISTLYTHIGDGIDMSAANSTLISALQGFQLEAEDALEIIDKFTGVANNFPIDSAGIGEALQRSAASFYAANTDLSKSIALIAGTNSVVQNPDAVGNMWKTVSMRIRGAKQELEDIGEETDGMVGSATQLRDLIQGLTGFDIMVDEAGTQFKDIYEIVVGIGHEWENLTDIEQAELLEVLAGKQGNALSAALNNISMIEDAYRVAENSAGSALREQEEYEKGIQYSLNRLEASFQTFSNHILKSDFLKGVIDFGNGAVNVLDTVTNKLGSLGTIRIGAEIFGITEFIKNFAQPWNKGTILNSLTVF